MLVPRRVRRRLLLPPGWVALGFLLLLGCQALRPWQRQLRQWSVLQVTMPLLKLKSEDIRHFSNDYLILYETVEKINSIRPWHTVEFSGNYLADFLSAVTTESAIRKIIADTSHAGGVRIRFLPGATYANLVNVLDIMNYTNQKKYFLNIHHQPTTLYAVTDEPIHIKPEPPFSCGIGRLNCCVIPKSTGLQVFIIDAKNEIMVLLSRPWRLSTLLLILIGSLSSRHLLRPGYRRGSF